MEIGELESMGDSLRPGAIVGLLDRRVYRTFAVFCKLGTDKCKNVF